MGSEGFPRFIPACIVQMHYAQKPRQKIAVQEFHLYTLIFRILSSSFSSCTCSCLSYLPQLWSHLQTKQYTWLLVWFPWYGPIPSEQKLPFSFFKRTDIFESTLPLKKKHFWLWLYMCYEVNWPYGYLCMYRQDIVLKYVRVYCTVYIVVLRNGSPPYSQNS